MNDKIEEQKKSLIDLIVWYRDEYHKKDSVHTEMIHSIMATNDSKKLDMFEQIVDGWIDY